MTNDQVEFNMLIGKADALAAEQKFDRAKYWLFLALVKEVRKIRIALEEMDRPDLPK